VWCLVPFLETERELLSRVSRTVLAKAAARTFVPGRKTPAPAPAEPGEPDAGAVLEVRDLTVTFPGGVTPVRELSLSVAPGEIVGLVGESGSGKSLTAAAVGGLVPYLGTVTYGRLTLGGRDVAAISDKELGTALAICPNRAYAPGSTRTSCPAAFGSARSSRWASWPRRG
jgi:ABC-type transport system involved in cytochrome bd biosynthesis fused ATPase/permease subunit